eukprot:m.51055 g.51055  ORF g.51055 m.51055 type:complete len:68 (-) comp21387_c0_seq1:165-368(-)
MWLTVHLPIISQKPAPTCSRATANTHAHTHPHPPYTPTHPHIPTFTVCLSHARTCAPHVYTHIYSQL